MFAHIHVTDSISRVLHYHQNKLEQGKAECLHAANFIKDLKQLSWDDKLFHFTRLNSRNERARKNTVHIDLNFHPSDVVSNSKMKDIAVQYMKEMGFGNQPFLVYRHYDTPHPHAHVASTNIGPNGKRIHLIRSDFYDSITITQKIDQKYGLRPLGQKQPVGERQKENPVQKVEYGKNSLYPAFSRVLEHVVLKYLYTNLEELNVILNLYNIIADRGREQSFTYRHGGLVYKALYANGKKISPYIKASALNNKYTWKELQNNFLTNQSLREPHRQHLIDTIDRTLFNSALSPPAFQQKMKTRRISTIIQKDKEGRPQNIWYIDHETKAVFDGDSLGEKYTAAAISHRCVSEEIYQKQQLKEQERLRLRLPSL